MIIKLQSELPGLSGPALVDDIGIPRYWAAAWSSLLPPGNATSTLLKKLRQLNRFYEHSDEVLGSGGLDDALGDLNTGALADALESFFLKLRKSEPIKPATEEIWQTDRIRSLPPDVVAHLYHVLDPECALNPFRAGHSRWTVYPIFILLLHQGLRPVCPSLKFELSRNTQISPFGCW